MIQMEMGKQDEIGRRLGDEPSLSGEVAAAQMQDAIGQDRICQKMHSLHVEHHGCMAKKTEGIRHAFILQSFYKLQTFLDRPVGKVALARYAVTPHTFIEVTISLIAVRRSLFSRFRRLRKSMVDAASTRYGGHHRQGTG